MSSDEKRSKKSIVNGVAKERDIRNGAFSRLSNTSLLCPPTYPDWKSKTPPTALTLVHASNTRNHTIDRHRPAMATPTDLLASVPWTPFPAPTSPTGYLKSHVPYHATANRLQYLDIWTPSTTSTPHNTTIPPRPGHWLIYIHGGAWRDPAVLAASFTPTATHLLASPSITHIAGLASLNYSLSPHPSHPTDPSPPSDPSQPADPARAATHPQHIHDVLAALAFLQRLTGLTHDYVLLGHSCGATLALQAAADHARWGAAAAALRVARPAAVVGLNGLYDLPGLVRDPGPAHARVQPVYADFTRRAFGEDEAGWGAASPAVFLREGGKEWREARRVVLVQSREDSLVPYRQTEGMLGVLRGAFGERVGEMEAGGDHNALWQEGKRMAEIAIAVVKEL